MSDDVITNQEMEHLKNLARLELSPEETQSLKGDINSVLQYFEELKALDTEAVKELVRPLEAVNVFREDTVKPSMPHDQAMAVATEWEEGYYKVPRTVDTES